MPINFGKNIAYSQTRYKQLAQWFSRTSLFGLIGIPFLLIAYIPIYCIVSWCVSVVVFIMEFPVFGRIFKDGSLPARFFSAMKSQLYRSIAYAIFSCAILSSIATAITFLLIPGGLLVISAFLNAISLIKKEGKADSPSAHVLGTAAAATELV
ncbi:hypothetical protein MDAP_000763 [Mitosporidium daphniae]